MIEVSLPIPAASIDAIDEFLLELGDTRWMVSHDLPTGQARLIGIFETEADARDGWGELKTQPLLAAAAEPAFRVLEDQDWRDSYKIHFKPWKFGRLHWVPIWERSNYPITSGDAVIWLDPGLAFGTGNHETTRLCCERLVTLAEKIPLDSPILDAGCGSGILALSAARLGFSNVAGFDNDPEAVRVSLENAALNQLEGKVDFFVGDLVTGLESRSARVLLANIQADVLMRFARELISAVAPGGALVLSGILAREIEQVRATFESLTPTWKTESRVLGEWADLQLLRP